MRDDVPPARPVGAEPGDAAPASGRGGAIGTVRFERRGAIGSLIFDRPSVRNAMTETMYAQLEAAIERAAEAGIRVLTLRGVGGTFVAGTDIATFQSFRSAEDGVHYERRIDHVIAMLEAIPVPTVAVVEGVAAGAGLMFAAVCDLRICTPDARFGAPIARTVGNCLSVANTARLVAHFGVARTKDLLLMADLMTATEAQAAGFVREIVPREALDAHVADLCARLLEHAPITMTVTKEAIRRIVAAGLPSGDDLVGRAYGSADFREGVAAFLAKRPPRWEGS